MTTKTLTLSTVCFKDYFELTKPRLASLVMLSTLVGFVLAAKTFISVPLLISTLLGTAFVAGGSMALNQWMESDRDALMARTAARPIPSGRIQPLHAFVFGVLLSLLGLLILLFAVNVHAMLLAAITTLSYLLLYTPLKRKTSLCTLVGAVPGALPPLIGWAAVVGAPPTEAWALFALIFFWQVPHFLAIAWIYRDDFSKADFHMLSVDDENGERVSRQAVFYTLALLPTSLLPALLGMVGAFYLAAALVCGIIFLAVGLLSLKNMSAMARPLFRTSVIYLTVIFILLMVDKI